MKTTRTAMISLTASILTTAIIAAAVYSRLRTLVLYVQDLESGHKLKLNFRSTGLQV